VRFDFLKGGLWRSLYYRIRSVVGLCTNFSEASAASISGEEGKSSPKPYHHLPYYTALHAGRQCASYITSLPIPDKQLRLQLDRPLLSLTKKEAIRTKRTENDIAWKGYVVKHKYVNLMFMGPCIIFIVE